MLILLGAGLLLGYGLLCLVSPVAKCPRTKTIKRKGRKPKVRPCPKCRGRGHRVRPGARLVHQIAWSLAGDRLKGHFRDRYEEMTSDARYLADD